VATDAAMAVAEEINGSAEVFRPRWPRGKKRQQ
jgi:hypothetical protein